MKIENREMTNIINLFTEGLVENNGREFTRLVGGFSENSEVMTVKQLAELMGYDNKTVNKTINRHIESFEESVDIIDLKNSVPEWNPLLESLGFTKQSIANSKNIYILSKSGVLMYLKFAEGERGIELYKNFLEDYFRTKAENKVMENTIKGQLEVWEQKKALAFGLSIMAKSTEDKIKHLEEVEDANINIIKLEKSITKKETYNQFKEQYGEKIEIAEVLTNDKNSYDLGTIAKTFAVDNMGRNNLFKWLKEKKILTSKNEPYQQYMKYFKVILTSSPNGQVNTKPLLKAGGISFLIKRLKEDGKVVNKTAQEVLEELNNTQEVK